MLRAILKFLIKSQVSGSFCSMYRLKPLYKETVFGNVTKIKSEYKGMILLITINIVLRYPNVIRENNPNNAFFFDPRTVQKVFLPLFISNS